MFKGDVERTCTPSVTTPLESIVNNEMHKKHSRTEILLKLRSLFIFFYFRHSGARVEMTEDTFGILKRRFPVLKGMKDSQLILDRV